LLYCKKTHFKKSEHFIDTIGERVRIEFLDFYRTRKETFKDNV